METVSLRLQSWGAVGTGEALVGPAAALHSMSSDVPHPSLGLSCLMSELQALSDQGPQDS